LSRTSPTHHARIAAGHAQRQRGTIPIHRQHCFRVEAEAVVDVAFPVIGQHRPTGLRTAQVPEYHPDQGDVDAFQIDAAVLAAKHVQRYRDAAC
jgi:hypothetical protein